MPTPAALFASAPDPVAVGRALEADEATSACTLDEAACTLDEAEASDADALDKLAEALRGDVEAAAELLSSSATGVKIRSLDFPLTQ